MTEAPHHCPGPADGSASSAPGRWRAWIHPRRREQSRGEEAVNSISHGLALVCAIVGSPFLIARAFAQGDQGFIAGTIVFSATAILLYLASTLYHALPTGKAKRVFRIIDHSVIFLLIAGTYTPFTLGVLRGAGGLLLFSIIWGLAAAGVAMKILSRKSHPILSTCLYLLMGWIIVFALDPLLSRIPMTVLLWLLAGGLSYTLGVAFFATDSQLKYGHLIWHLFVIAGTACHYFALLCYAV